MPTRLILFALTFASVHQLLLAQSEKCSVSLQNGTVIGTVVGTANPDKNVCAYTGIPYARPPVDGLRFQPPQPSQAWEGNLNATSPPNWCPQASSPPPGFQISEDCLYLNVFQPQRTQEAELVPVMIWIHGGGFTVGSSDQFYPTKLLARGDVILVVIQYRLGLLGFLSTGDAEVSGNNGLKDQALSIRWVNENIRAFGGNPNNITLFGNSAGGASVVYQLLSPLNKGLVHGAIAQSGTALTFLALDRKPTESAKIMSQKLNCPVDNGSKEMVTCLRQVSWQNIIQAQSEFETESSLNFKHALATITPVVEPANVPGAFITDEPVNIMKTADILNVPVMLGTNKHDGSLNLAIMFLGYFGPKNLSQNADYMKQEIVPALLSYVNEPETDPGNRVVASSVELAFLSGVNRSSWSESMPGLVDLASILFYKSAAQNTAEILSSRNRNVYMYSFEHHSNNSQWPMFFGDLYPDIPIQSGISHGDDLMYMFDFGANFTDDDQAFSDVYTDLWLNFAKFGNPTPSPDARFDNWIPYNSLDEPYLKLNVTPTLQHGFRNSWRPNGFEWN